MSGLTRVAPCDRDVAVEPVEPPFPHAKRLDPLQSFVEAFWAERAFPDPAHLLRRQLVRVVDALDALIFTAPKGGPLRLANFRRRVLWPSLERAGLPHTLRIHDLRHTCATTLISRGVHPKAIQHHLGHANIDITMDRYGHLLPDKFNDVAAQLDAAHTQGSASTSADANAT